MDGFDVNFEYEEKRWAPLIGKFILDFANIEEFLNEVIRHHIRDTLLDESYMPDNLGKRIKCKHPADTPIQTDENLAF